MRWKKKIEYQSGDKRKLNIFAKQKYHYNKQRGKTNIVYIIAFANYSRHSENLAIRRCPSLNKLRERTCLAWIELI